MFLFALVGIAFYLLFAYSLYKMAINASLENPWMAWIPILQWYIIGKIIKSLKISNYLIPNIEMTLPAASLVSIILSGIPVIGNLISIANYILTILALNKLYKMYKPESANLYTILSIFALPIPFIFLTIKDFKPMYVPD
jgi:hypothetical protein